MGRFYQLAAIVLMVCIISAGGDEDDDDDDVETTTKENSKSTPTLKAGKKGKAEDPDRQTEIFTDQVTKAITDNVKKFRKKVYKKFNKGFTPLNNYTFSMFYRMHRFKFEFANGVLGDWKTLTYPVPIFVKLEEEDTYYATLTLLHGKLIYQKVNVKLGKIAFGHERMETDLVNLNIALKFKFDQEKKCINPLQFKVVDGSFLSRAMPVWQANVPKGAINSGLNGKQLQKVQFIMINDALTKIVQPLFPKCSGDDSKGNNADKNKTSTTEANTVESEHETKENAYEATTDDILTTEDDK